MLSLARENQAKSGLTNVEFLKGEIEHIPLPDNAVDVIISNCVINLSADKDRVIAEAFRVLKPGGRFAVSDVVVKGDDVPAAVRRSMAQVFANLLANAAKYSDAGSRIIVGASREPAAVTVTIKDQGIGLAPDTHERIFEPFVQQPEGRERAAGGLGLGLAIVRNLVAAHGGTVRADSAGAGQGSEFIVELPDC